MSEKLTEGDLILQKLAEKTTQDIESLINSVVGRRMSKKESKEFDRLINLISSIGYVTPVGK